MTRFTNRFAVAALVLGAAALAGCASSNLVNMWSAPDFSTPMQKMLVVAMKPNEGNRRIMEDAIVAELSRNGVQAIPSYQAFDGAMPDTQAVVDYVKANGVNGVLVAARMPDIERTEERPGYITTEPRTAYSSWSGRYHTYYPEVLHEGTTETLRIVPHRIDVWYSDGKGGQLVWTAEERSVDPSSVNEVSRSLSMSVVSELAKAGFIPKRPSSG